MNWGKGLSTGGGLLPGGGLSDPPGVGCAAEQFLKPTLCEIKACVFDPERQ